MNEDMVFAAFWNVFSFSLILRTQAESKQIPPNQCQEAEIVANIFLPQMFLGWDLKSLTNNNSNFSSSFNRTHRRTKKS